MNATLASVAAGYVVVSAFWLTPLKRTRSTFVGDALPSAETGTAKVAVTARIQSELKSVCVGVAEVALPPHASEENAATESTSAADPL